MERVIKIHQALLCIQETSRLCTNQLSHKDGLFIACRSCSIYVCTIKSQGAWWPFFVGIGEFFNYFYFILYAPSDAYFICTFIQLSEICCCQDKYLTQVSLIPLLLSLCKWAASPMLFVPQNTVVTDCVIDATSKIISTTGALTQVPVSLKTTFVSAKLHLWIWLFSLSIRALSEWHTHGWYFLCSHIWKCFGGKKKMNSSTGIVWDSLTFSSLHIVTIKMESHHSESQLDFLPLNISVQSQNVKTILICWNSLILYLFVLQYPFLATSTLTFLIDIFRQHNAFDKH